MTQQTQQSPAKGRSQAERLVAIEKQVEANTREVTELRADSREFRSEVNARFNEVNTRIDTLREESNARFIEVNGRIDALGEQVNGRIDRLTYVLLGAVVTILAAIIGVGIFA